MNSQQRLYLIKFAAGALAGVEAGLKPKSESDESISGKGYDPKKWSGRSIPIGKTGYRPKNVTLSQRNANLNILPLDRRFGSDSKNVQPPVK